WDIGPISLGRTRLRLSTGLPVPKRRRLREAGFTEQRPPPAFDGGRITGRCLPSPL
ncbi:unnamed protein product, partial [Brassica napus]